MYQLLSPVRSGDNERMLYVYVEYFQMFKEIDANVLTTYNPSEEDIDKLVEFCDGLLLTGGKDMDANYYHRDNLKDIEIERHEIDALELTLIDRFLKANKPIFGICRGIQSLNVYYGGSLIQDIPTSIGTNHLQKQSALYHHNISVLNHTQLEKYITGDIPVNSFHHQCIDEVGEGLKVNCYSDDGLVEGVENDQVFAVQWHPERCNDEMRKALLLLFKERLEKSLG